MRKGLKLFILAAPILGVALAYHNHFIITKPALASASDTATYGTNSGPGYFTCSETSSFNPTHYTKDYGFYYIGASGDLEGVIQGSLYSSSQIKFNAPFIVPYISDGYQHRYGLYRTISAGESPYIEPEDVWYVSDVSTDCQLYLDKTGITLTGIPLAGGSSTSLPITSVTARVSSGNRVSVQDLTVNTSANLYNYSDVTINLGSVKYLDTVNSTQTEPGFYELEYLQCDYPLPSSQVTFTFNPSSQGVINGTDVTSLTDEAIWYEGPHDSGTRRSYRNCSTLVDYLKDRLINDIIISVYNNITYSSETHFSFSETKTYTNSLGSNGNFTSLDPYSPDLFTHGGTYDIWVAPIFASSTLDPELKHNITKLVAIPKDNTALLHEIVNEQVEKLVKECSVFDDVHPATPFSPEESVLFNDYAFKRDVSVSNNKSATYKYYSPTSSTVGSITKGAGESININSPQTLYTFQYKNINGSWTEYKNIFSANALSSSGWLDQAVASGTSTFSNVWNSFFSSGLNANQYVTNSDETNNKVTFKSKDKLFVRVTKDDEDPVTLNASTTYFLSTTGYSTLDSSTNAVYDFSDPGDYVIELINRSDNSKITKYLSIYDESEIYVSQTANNAELDLDINNPAGTSLLDLKIYHSSTKTGYTSLQSKVLEIEELSHGEITSNNFLLVDKDADDKPIVTGTKSYKFENKGCYYIKVQVLNETKYFYVYYNYIPPEPDEIHINISDQILDVGDMVNYEISYSCTSGEEPVTKLNYNYVTSNGRVTVDKTNGKITAVSPGVVSVTFTLENELDSVTINFTVKEPPAPEPEPEPEPGPTPTPTPEPGGDSSSENPPADPSSESPSENPSSSDSSSETPVDPAPEEKTRDNTPIVIAIIAGIGAVAVGSLIFVIVRARKTGRMKK